MSVYDPAFVGVHPGPVTDEARKELLKEKLLRWMRIDEDLYADVKELAKTLGLGHASNERVAKALVEFAPSDMDGRLKMAEQVFDQKLSIGLAAAGTVDPSPFMDGVGVLHSLYMAGHYSDWWQALDAPLFLVSVIPGLGDCIGKTALAVRMTRRIARLRRSASHIGAMVLHRTRFLGMVAYADQFRRTALGKQFFARFKNDPRFAAWVEDQLPTLAPALNEMNKVMRSLLDRYRGGGVPRPAAKIDLSTPKGLSRSPITDGDHAVGKLRGTGNYTTASRYEVRVLALRRGDSVSAVSASSGKVRELKLGRFLGAGNTTHVFELADSTDEVLRIPFLAGHHIGRNWRSKKVVRQTRRFPEATVKHRTWYDGMTHTGVAAVVDWGQNFEYVVVKRVNVLETGYDFVNRLSKQGRKTATDAKRYDDLEKALKEARSRCPDGDYYAPAVDQFGWDGRSWALLDWE